MLLQPGLYSLTADIASLGGSFVNGSGGRFTAFLGSTPIDNYDFGTILGNFTERNSQAVQVSIPTAGTYTFSFQFARPFINNFDTPDNCIDNIKLTLITPYGVPEPSEWGLAAAGLRCCDRRCTPSPTLICEAFGDGQGVRPLFILISCFPATKPLQQRSYP
ncbi:hypothetical protein F183_A05380 [Bryobacterales bacterium F-183]|nr:hypothetical protein F183_A05380 [Bryobacterales bacterium F-183]